MMEASIDQYLATQRERVEMQDRDKDHYRDRDVRDRRRDRDRDRRDSGRDRDRRRDRGPRDRDRRDRDSRRDRDRDWDAGQGWDRSDSEHRDRYPDWHDRDRDRPYSPSDIRRPDYSYPQPLPSVPGEEPPRLPPYPHDPYRGADLIDGRLSPPEYQRSGSRDGRDSLDGNHRDRDGPRSDDRGADKWITDEPTNTVILKKMPLHIDENDIRGELMLFGVPVKEVRLMKRKDTGVSRGFAFVEFQCVEDARRWMDHNQARLLMQGQYDVHMYYSTPKNQPADNNRADSWTRTDWICSKCAAHNFKRRDYCFKCSISKEQSDRTKEGDGYDQVGSNPCNTLIFRGLDALTTEDKIVEALTSQTGGTVKNIKVIRDDATQTSRGYAFAEFGTVLESSQVLARIKDSLPSPFEVDGKVVLVDYAKNTFNTTMATMNQWKQNTPYSSSSYYPSQTDQSAGYYGADGQYYDYYNQQGYTADGKSIQSDVTNAAAAVAQAAIQQAQAAKNYQKQHEEVQKQVVAQIQQQQKYAEMTPEERLAHQAQEWSTHQGDPADSQDYPTYPIPDVSTYQYDETSGYYYDPVTTLYYDANTQYYYNGNTGQFLYWDGDKQTYLPAPTQDGQGTSDEKKDDEKTSKKEKEKKEKVKIAKKIAKDMEKWAKTLNAQKDSQKDVFKKNFTPIGQGGDSAVADVGFAVLEKSTTERKGIDINLLKSSKEENKLMPPPPAPGGQAAAAQPGLVASYGSGDSDEEDEDGSNAQAAEAKLVDLVKMACLLCKRQFPNKDALNRHTQLSDLHKTNLEEFRKNQKGMQQQYRDRAKERREKFGIPDPPLRKKKAPPPAAPEPYEQPTKAGIGGDNIGNKMMQKMGWTAGQGLGREKQGITDPIEAMRRQSSAGLGSRGSNYNITPGTTYKETVKKVMFARYQELQ